MKTNQNQINKNRANLPKIIIVLRAILKNTKGEILILKRSETDSYKYNQWELPGGKLDKDESLQKSLLREIYEECGLKIKEPKIFLPVFQLHNKSKGGKYKGYYYLLQFFELDFIDETQNVKLSDEHSDFQWINPTEIDMKTLTKDCQTALNFLFSCENNATKRRHS